MICGVRFDEINEMLTQDVEIHQQTNTSDGAGGFDTTWTPAETLKGRLSPMKGMELDQYRKINPKIDSKIYIKKGSSLHINSNEDKAIIDGYSYDILFIKNPVSADEFLILYVGSNGK